MATIRRFEEIESWQKPRELVKAIYTATGTGDFSKDYGLKDQIRRAASWTDTGVVDMFGAIHLPDNLAEMIQGKIDRRKKDKSITQGERWKALHLAFESR